MAYYRDEEFPPFLTAMFMEHILKEHFRERNLRALSFRVDYAHDKTNDFLSHLYRVEMRVRRNLSIRDMSFIIKIENKVRSGTLFANNYVFPREIKAYDDSLQRILSRLQKINKYETLSPHCYYTTLETGNTKALLVLEDLKAYNVRHAPFGLLDLEHTTLVLRKLGKFHAASAIVQKERAGAMNYFEEGPVSFNIERQDVMRYFDICLQTLLLEINNWLGYDQIADKLSILQQSISLHGLDLYLERPGVFRVLNHGDLCTNNILFKYNADNLPTDALLIDFQMAYYGSPAIDLNNFLYSSVEELVRRKHIKHLLYEYHKFFKDTARRLCHPRHYPSIRDLNIELIRKSLQAVMASVCTAPIMLKDPLNHINYDILYEYSRRGTGYRLINMRRPRYKTFLRRTLEDFELSGYIDF